VTLRFEYRADDRTLRDEEIDAVHWPIVEALKAKFNAEIR
jgi:phenylalanyl-tRNA synthetase beta subunit